MAQPVVARGAPAAGRERLLDAALETFYERGYHGSNVRDIAARAGVTPASLYYHFKGKQELLHVTLTTIMDTALASTEAALGDPADDPAVRLRRLVEAWVRFHAQHHMAAAVGAAELSSLDNPARAAVVELRDRQERSFRDVVEEGARKGAFVAPNTGIAVKAILAMGVFVASWYRPGGDLTPDDVASIYGDIALATVGAPHGR